MTDQVTTRAIIREMDADELQELIAVHPDTDEALYAAAQLKQIRQE